MYDQHAEIGGKTLYSHTGINNTINGNEDFT